MKQDSVTQTQLSEEFDKFERKMDSKFSELKSDIFNKLDYVVAELEAAREDRELAVYQTRNHDEKIENHEKRIINLEEKLHPH